MGNALPRRRFNLGGKCNAALGVYVFPLEQQYLAKNPFGYRCHANTGVKFPQTD